VLDYFRRSIGFQAARFHFRKEPDEVMSFTGSFTAADRVLLIMPLDGSPLFSVAPVIAVLTNRLAEDNLTIVTLEHSTEALTALPRSHIVRILPNEITTWFLPRRGFVERVHRRTYDAAIDLNLDFNLPSGYICKESKARVRVGFAGKRADAFYNLQIQVNPAQSRTVLYERMAQCLQMF
jgi:hypothetical protein